jgi:hypothetical protein
MKNGSHTYLDCVARCARGFRCRHRTSPAVARHGTLLCAVDGQERTLRPRRIWAAIVLPESYHAKH